MTVALYAGLAAFVSYWIGFGLGFWFGRARRSWDREIRHLPVLDLDL